MTAWAKRGARGVCVVGNGLWANTADRSHKVHGPAKGDRLTILNVEHEPHGVYFEFAEWPSLTFKATAFRPAVEPGQEQDIALFSHHLKQSAIPREVVHG